MNRAVRLEVIGHIVDDDSELLKMIALAQYQFAGMNALANAHEITVDLGKRSNNLVRKADRKVADHGHRTRKHGDKRKVGGTHNRSQAALRIHGRELIPQHGQHRKKYRQTGNQRGAGCEQDDKSRESKLNFLTTRIFLRWYLDRGLMRFIALPSGSCGRSRCQMPFLALI